MSVYITNQSRKQNLSHIWRTTIQEDIQGGEKRTALYTWPRIHLENQIQFLTDAERRFIRASLFTDLHNVWYFPLVFDKTVLASEASSGQKVLTVEETVYRHFYDGRKCLLLNPSDWESYEYGTIDTVDSSTQITLKDNLADTWGVKTKVFPLYGCRIKPEQEIDLPWSELNLLDILAEENFESVRSFSYTLPSSGAETYNDLDLFLTKPLNRGVKEKYRHPNTLLGFYGMQTPFSTFGDTRMSMSREFIFSTREKIRDFLNFFDSKQGRFGSFYAPTWVENVTPTAAIDSADISLTVEKMYLSSAQLVGRYLYIQFPDKSYTCKEIISPSVGTLITLDSAIGTSVTESDLSNMLISFLYETRFGIDEAKLDFLKLGVAKTTLNLVEL